MIERTATAPRNFEMAEIFKAAAGMGRIHLPDHPLARLELEYLQIDGKRIHAPTIGQVQTDDMAGAIINVCYSALQEAPPMLFARLAATRLRGSQTGGLRAMGRRRRWCGRTVQRRRPLLPGSTSAHYAPRGIDPNRRPHPGIDLQWCYATATRSSASRQAGWRSPLLPSTPPGEATVRSRTVGQSGRASLAR